MLQPGEYLQIVRDLQNPNITGTFYVRATIKNAKTLATLATMDLTDQGNYLFSGEWLVSGIRAPGYFIVSTVVYTDSGYTTRSEDYGNYTETYQVRDLTSANNFPVNLIPEASADVDYKKIRRIFKEELAAVLTALKGIEPKDLDDSKIIAEIQAAIEAQSTIGKNTQSSFEVLNKMLRNKFEIVEGKIKDPEKLDLTQVLQAISNVEEKQDSTLEKLELHKKYIAAIHAAIDRVHGIVNSLDQTMGLVSNQLRALFDKVQGFMKASEEVKALFDQVKNFSAAWKKMTGKVEEAEKAMSELTPEEPEEKKEEKS